ncbi:MAG: phosphoglycerate mutase family protein [Candidatus Dependentiae bacterium]|nr:phosphoglycerate mutase family protein [Candidatus Dependentiae bacterium]
MILPLIKLGYCKSRTFVQEQPLCTSHIYSSPLKRAQQTAEIINHHCNALLAFHAGLREIVDDRVAIAISSILDLSNTTLIVSHGEVYRVLLRILNAQATQLNAKNGGLYFFSPPGSHSDQWMVEEL